MCDERDQLIGYLYNEGDAIERRRVEVHLETCETCRDEIRGLRHTREDLLAWDVPERPSVWTPFAPARVAPAWRDVPRWALAAAASAIFVIGAAGGFVTRVLLPVPVQSAAAQPAAGTPTDMTAIQAQLRDLVRSEMGPRATPVSTSAAPTTAPVTTDDLMRQVRLLIAQSEQRGGQRLDARAREISMTLLSDLGALQSVNKEKIDQLAVRVNSYGEMLKVLQTTPPGR
jgi:hypothetical protein